MNFTVLMSLYAKESPDYFNRCLQSLHEQTVSIDEIVLVLVGPITTSLEDQLRRWGSVLNIVIVRLPNNVGLGRALNEGLKCCKNDWVFRMDTDDICIPDRFEKQIAFIHNNPNVDLFGGQILEFKEYPGDTSKTRVVPVGVENIYNYSKYRNPFNHMTVAYKKSMIDEMGGYLHHLWMEDYNLWLRVLSCARETDNMNDVLVNVRAGSSMLARRRGIKYVRSEIQLMMLKYRLGFLGFFGSMYVFVMRALPRLMPTTVVEKIYSIARSR